MTESRLTWLRRKWSDVVGGAYSKVYLSIAWHWKWSMAVHLFRLPPVRWLVKTFFCKVGPFRDYHDRRLRPSRKKAIAESARNLRLQLAVEPREGLWRSYAKGVNANPQFWKYRWRIFIALPYKGHSVPKRWVWAMPELGHAEFLRRQRWLLGNRIEFYIDNRRYRREHPLWDPEAKVIKEEPIVAPAYDEDPDEIADDGHR